MRSIVDALRNGLYGGGDERPVDVLFYKIVETYIVYRALEYCWQWGFFIQDIGDVVLPLGIANYVDVRFMFENGVSTAVAGVASALILAGYLRYGRYSYLIGFALFHLLFAARFCLGEIPHSSNFVGLAILLFGIAPLLHDNGTARRRFALGTLIFFIGLAYTTGAFSKLVATGVTWADGRHLWIWIAEKAADKYSEFGTLTYNPLQRLILDHWWLSTLSLTYGVITEFCAPAFWFRKTRPYAALALLGLHAGIFGTMRIMFSASMVIIALVGFPWADWLQKRFPSAATRLSASAASVLVRFG